MLDPLARALHARCKITIVAAINQRPLRGFIQHAIVPTLPATWASSLQHVNAQKHILLVPRNISSVHLFDLGFTVIIIQLRRVIVWSAGCKAGWGTLLVSIGPVSVSREQFRAESQRSITNLCHKRAKCAMLAKDTQSHPVMTARASTRGPMG